MAIRGYQVKVVIGGQMWYESVEGKGSTFYFTIKSPQLSNIPIIETIPNCKGKHIVIVDHSNATLELLQSRLVLLGIYFIYFIFLFFSIFLYFIFYYFLFLLFFYFSFF